jgi:recombination protein RecA
MATATVTGDAREGGGGLDRGRRGARWASPARRAGEVAGRWLSGVERSAARLLGAPPGELGDERDGGPLPSGSIALDLALGGGLPRGRLVAIAGDAGSGKSSLALGAVAALQRRGGTAAWIDIDHTLAAPWAAELGVRTDALVAARPRDGEQAFAIAEELLRSRAVDLLVLDSLAALPSEGELRGGLALEPQARARLLARGLPRLARAARRTRVAVYVVAGAAEGAEARRLWDLGALRLALARPGDEEAPGERVHVAVADGGGEVGPTRASYVQRAGEGISRSAEGVDLGLRRGLLRRRGGGLWWCGRRLGSSRRDAEAALARDAGVLARLEAELRGERGELRRA